MTGDNPGSLELSFKPGPVIPGNYHFKVGTAGSASLILQTVLPALLHINKEAGVTIEGGTHNPMAPPFDFLEKSFAKALAGIGYNVDLGLQSYGFYPAGGGRITANISASENIRHFKLTDKGKLLKRNAIALSAMLPDNVNSREIDLLKNRLKWNNDELKGIKIRSSGPGNVVIIELEYEFVTGIFTGFGEKKIPVAEVVEQACKSLEQYEKSDAPVDEHLADQLLLPLSIGKGGAFNTNCISGHTSTNIEIIKKFLDVSIFISKISDDNYSIFLK